MDHDIEIAAGKSISDIFTSDGEPVFRELEENAVAAGLAEHDGVLALGGGAILSARTRERARGHVVLFLNVGMTEGIQRTGLSSARPLLVRRESAGDVQGAARRPAAALPRGGAVEVLTDARTPDEVVAEAVRRARRTGIEAPRASERQ